MLSTQCLECKHYLGFNTCEAFKKRIPDIIFTGEHDHTKPYKGDNGIRFEPVEQAKQQETKWPTNYSGTQYAACC